MMSRPVAGTRGGTLIITLPGSPKGAKENLEAIIKLLPHACLQAKGLDSRALHVGGVKKLERDAGVSSSSSGQGDKQTHQDHSHGHGHSHGHSHGKDHGHAIPKAHTKPEDRPQSNDPSAGPSQRYRESPYPMLTVEDAILTILSQTPALEEIKKTVESGLVGHVLAEDIEAREAVPAFRASIVDGYAVMVGEGMPSTKGVFPVASISRAAPGSIPPLEKGQIARITTGAPLPEGATSVVMVEDTVLKSMTNDGKEEKEVEILTDEIEPDENVRAEGSDIAKGSTILKRGDRIGPGELGLLASVGVSQVKVFRKSTIGVLSTGDELIDHDVDRELRLGEVRDCNRPTIQAVLRHHGYETIDCGIASDRSDSLESCLRDALRTSDVLITSGGVSMGELDLLKPTIERKLGGTIHFGRVAMKPGKPTTFATVQLKDNSGNPRTKLIFSLPGNPASAVTCTNLFVLPCLAKASGQYLSLVENITESNAWKRFGAPRIQVVSSENVRCDKSREEYQRAVVIPGNDGRLVASITGGQRSSRIGSFQSANALLVLPAGGTIEKGQLVEAILIGSLG